MEIAGIRSAEALMNPSGKGSDEEALGKTQFLELMITQMNNQDPLDPAKNEDFIAQLAQFSSLEGIQNLNTSFASMAQSLQSSMAMEAASLVGRNVLVPTNQGVNQGNGLAGGVDVPASAGNVVLEISGGNGTLVKRLDLGPQTPGVARFGWDGLDESGQVSPPGLYRVNAFSEVGGERRELSINMPDQVVSVSIADGSFLANLASGTSVSAAEIKEIQ